MKVQTNLRFYWMSTPLIILDNAYLEKMQERVKGIQKQIQESGKLDIDFKGFTYYPLQLNVATGQFYTLMFAKSFFDDMQWNHFPQYKPSLFP